MTQPPASPVPPYEPRRSPASETAELREQIARLESVVQRQQDRLDFLRHRSGWILFWAVLATLGSCGSHDTDVNDGPLRSEVQQVQTTLDELKTQVGDLQDEVRSGDASTDKAPTAKKTGN